MATAPKEWSPLLLQFHSSALLANDFLFEMYFCYIICHTKSKTALQLSVMPFPAESEGSKLNLNAACLADII